MELNAIAIMFTDDLNHCDVQMSKHVEDILRLYKNESIVFSKTKSGQTLTITIEVEEEECVAKNESPCT